MNNLESIVPPLELCKRIPAGKFEDSALVYTLAGELKPRRIIIDGFEHRYDGTPAPTLEEILEKLTANGLDVPAVSYDGNEWCAFYTYHNSGNPMCPKFDENPATAALRLFLEVAK